MAYLGRELTSGNYLKLDDISSQFNGSTTTFNLTSGGQAFYPGSGFTFLPDSGEHGAFVSPCPFVGWRLNSEYKWEAPVPKPSTRWEEPEGILNMYLWDNKTIEWKLHRYNIETGEEIVD